MSKLLMSLRYHKYKYTARVEYENKRYILNKNNDQ